MNDEIHVNGGVSQLYSEENAQSRNLEKWFWNILAIFSGVAGIAPLVIDFLTKSGYLKGIDLHLPTAVEGGAPVAGVILAIIFFALAYHAEQKP